MADDNGKNCLIGLKSKHPMRFKENHMIWNYTKE